MVLTGFDIPKKALSTLNRIRTGHENCAQCLFQWNLTKTTNWIQDMSHIVNDCPNEKFIGDMKGLSRLDEGAIEWLMNQDLSL